MNELKKFESYNVFDVSEFIYEDFYYDRYVGFYIDKDKNERGFICVIDCDEVDLEDFKKITKADITIKQKVSLSSERVLDIFKNKIQDKVLIEKEQKKLIREFCDEDYINFYNDLYEN